MKKIRLIICMPILLLSFIGCSDNDDIVENSDVTLDVLSEINMLRVTGCKCGNEDMPAVPPLIANDILTATAINYADDMKQRNYFSHISPEGKSPAQRALEFGYTGSYVGEVIARNYTNTRAVVLAWKNSEDHCKAMMSSNYVEMGAGKSGKIWVVDFGK